MIKTETKILAGILISTLALVIFAVFFLTKSTPSNNGSKQTFNIDYSKGHKIGSDSAKVKLIEFSDFQCPACKAAQPTVDVILNLKNENLQFIYRNFPLPAHLNAKAAANFAEAAGEQGKYWEVHDKLFSTQSDWQSLPNPNEYFLKIGKELNLDEAKLKQALNKNSFADVVQADLNEGNSLGVDATPTFFLNGEKLTLSSFSDLIAAVKTALSK